MTVQKSFGLSLDVKEFIRHIQTDPTALEELYQALEEGVTDLPTNPLGACNLGTMENQQWFSIFVANSKEIAQGEPGHLIRPRSDKTKGRIILNLREQIKDHQAEVVTLSGKFADKGESTAVQSSEPSERPAPLSNDIRAKLLAKLGKKAAAPEVPSVPAEAQAALQG